MTRRINQQMNKSVMLAGHAVMVSESYLNEIRTVCFYRNKFHVMISCIYLRNEFHFSDVNRSVPYTGLHAK